MERKEEEWVCVTRAGGYIASWAVKLLLSKGYVVHGTVRDPYLFDYEGLYAAIAGCTGVLHVASPVLSDNPSVNSGDEVELAIKGTRNVVNACLKAKVKKVVVVSSVAVVLLNPCWPKDQPMDEICWSDMEFCKSTKIWYTLGKTIAESEALEFATRNELNIVTICLSLAFGPMLQSTLNYSSSFLLSYLKGGSEPVSGRDQQLVDVRDFAEALILLYEKPEAEGRYICSSYTIRAKDLVEKLKAMYPNYDYRKKCTWYPFGKAIAESETLEFGMRNELNIVTICPSLVIGLKLQSSLNLSSSLLLSYLKGEINIMNCRVQQLVDVRDFAEALLLLYEKPEAEGRYICSSYMIRPEVLVEKLKAMFPHYNYSEIYVSLLVHLHDSFTEEKGGPFDFNCKKLLDFEWKYRPLEEFA